MEQLVQCKLSFTPEFRTTKRTKGDEAIGKHSISRWTILLSKIFSVDLSKGSVGLGISMDGHYVLTTVKRSRDCSLCFFIFYFVCGCHEPTFIWCCLIDVSVQ